MMEAATAGQREPSQAEEKKAEEERGSADPRVRAARASADREGDEAAASVTHAAQGATLDEDEERGALDYLLGARPAIVHDITVDYETADGMRKLTFVVKSRDTKLIDEIEQRHTSRTLQIDRLAADAEIVAEFCTEIRDAAGKSVVPTSAQFRTVKRMGPHGPEDFEMASAGDAVAHKFSDQMGVISGVAMEIKRIAGFSPDRVGQAQRRLVSAAGN